MLCKKDSIVIYESTIYPGVTDELCTPILEEKSALIFNKEFSTGYSPERIVPGDRVNTIETIIKVVSASNKDALNVISFLYSSIIDAGIYKAPSIKVALVCVRHAYFQDFFMEFKGVLYDYKNSIGV